MQDRAKGIQHIEDYTKYHLFKFSLNSLEFLRQWRCDLPLWPSGVCTLIECLFPKLEKLLPTFLGA